MQSLYHLISVTCNVNGCVFFICLRRFKLKLELPGTKIYYAYAYAPSLREWIYFISFHNLNKSIYNLNFLFCFLFLWFLLLTLCLVCMRINCITLPLSRTLAFSFLIFCFLNRKLNPRVPKIALRQCPYQHTEHWKKNYFNS